MDAIRERLLTIASTRYYTQLDPEELVQLHEQLKIYLGSNDSKLSETGRVSLLEMLFYVQIYLSKDVDAQVVYKTVRDRLGEDAPSLYLMRAALIQINENDRKAAEYIQGLLDKKLEYDTDGLSYLGLQKRLISIAISAETRQGKEVSHESLLKKLVALIEKFPLDPELWWFTSNIYFELGQFDKAAYCLEELVIVMPFNYTAFGRLAEILYYKAIRVDKTGPNKNRTLQNALNNALRSVELSEMYLKGWSMVAVICTQLKNEKSELKNLSKIKIKEISDKSNTKDKETAKFILSQLV